MRAVLLGAAASIAAITLPSAPAQAQQFVSGQPFVNGTSIATGPFVQSPAFGGRCLDGFRGPRDGGRHRGGMGCNTGVILDYYGGEWALYNNRTWEPDSYNDWWHDNPGRAYPAWMRHNQTCDRMWWSGDTLIC